MILFSISSATSFGRWLLRYYCGPELLSSGSLRVRTDS
jgi:hypothetical protein